MPTLDTRKHIVPVDSDDEPNIGDVARNLSASTRDPIPVNSVADRQALVAALRDEGHGPSPDEPLMVYRKDAGAGTNLEYTADGTQWWTVNAYNSGWIALTPGLSFPGSISIVQELNGVEISVSVTGTIPNNTVTTIANNVVPVAMRPSSARTVPRDTSYLSAYGDGQLIVTTEGSIQVMNKTGAVSGIAAGRIKYHLG